MGTTRGGLAAGASAAALLFGLAATPLASTAAAPRPKARNDIRYSTEVVTPHVPWAARLPGGAIKGFFVPTVAQGRDMVELMQRLALEPTTVTIDPSWDVNCWGLGDFYGHEERGDRDDFRVVYGYVEEELTGTKPFEVIVLPGLNGWSRLTRPSRDAILRRVRDGAGLVLVHPFVGDVKGHPFLGDEPEGDTRIWDVSPLVNVPDDRVSDRGYPEPNREAIVQARWEVAKGHFITDGIDLSLVPSGASGGKLYRYEPAGDVLVQAGGSPVVAVKTYGKGRVVGLAWVSGGFVPEPVDPIETRTDWDYWEYEHALLARAVMWAAGRDADVRVRSLSASPEGASSGSLRPAGAPWRSRPARRAPSRARAARHACGATSAPARRRSRSPRPTSRRPPASPAAGRSSTSSCATPRAARRSTSAPRASTCRERPR